MTAIRPDRLGADQGGSGKTGPELFAPDRSGPAKLGAIDQAAANAFEGEIRDFVRRDVAFLRRPRNEADTSADPAAENLNALIRRVAGASMDEIDPHPPTLIPPSPIPPLAPIRNEKRRPSRIAFFQH